MDIKESKAYRNFIIAVGLIIALGVSAIYLGMAIRNNNLIRASILSRAKAHFDGIVVTRKWNAIHGGVYVEKTPGMESNPYLVNPDIRSTDGKIYTKKNPALMTREISELSQKNNLFFFHITSLKPLNPGNAPNTFEKQALELFEKRQEKEFYSDAIKDGRTRFHYMAPLFVEKSCLQCHASQGYKEGDVRGGISVWFDIDYITKQLKLNLLAIFVLTIITAFLLITIIYLLFRQLRAKLDEARALLDRMSKTDLLTEISNRRHLMERFKEELERSKRSGTELCCIMLDVDHFKSINDNFGHLKGDDVLRELAKILKNSVRTYDVLGRYGGEEFMILLPSTNLEKAAVLAERIRQTVERNLGGNSGFATDKNITISIGLTDACAGDTNIEPIVKRADEALYKAKEGGRNKVEIIGSAVC
jgi:diguanylate cyclase (GGDEF)-like protein